MLDKRQIQRAVTRWRPADSPAPIAARRLWERARSLAQTPAAAADIGGDGAFLRACYPAARVYALDMTAAALRGAPAAICADAESLPLAAQSLDLLWSTFCAEWTDHRLFFAEAARVLRTGGLFAFTTLGPGTLPEMRQVFAGGARVHDFTDMHDLGDALPAAGFSEPIMESERLTFTYAAAADALTDARRQGAANARRDRRPLGKTRWRQALAAYAEAFGCGGGRVYAGYEVIYATAWRAPPRPPAGESPLRFYRA